MSFCADVKFKDLIAFSGFGPFRFVCGLSHGGLPQALFIIPGLSSNAVFVALSVDSHISKVLQQIPPSLEHDGSGWAGMSQAVAPGGSGNGCWRIDSSFRGALANANLAELVAPLTVVAGEG